MFKRRKAGGAVALELNFGLIQAVRFAHALMETDFDIRVPAQHASTFEYLRSHFPVRFGEGTDGARGAKGLLLSHAEPLTGVGDVRRPLIFPHAITDRLRAMWEPDRSIGVSFCGLVTDARSAFLAPWLGDGVSATEALTPEQIASSNGDLVVWSSTRGRTFPVKAWDEPYFALLARSRYVLCPKGDFVWTYRFFEAALCGAIPVVEEACAAYDGFTFLHASDGVPTARWDADAAAENHRRAADLLTVPRDELTAALAASIR